MNSSARLNRSSVGDEKLWITAVDEFILNTFYWNVVRRSSAVKSREDNFRCIKVQFFK